MNKLISKIVGVFLGLALAAGTGVAIATSNNNAAKADAAEQSVTFSLTSSTNRTTINSNLIKYESNNVSFSIIKGSGTNVNNYCPGGTTNNTTQTRVYNGNSVEFTAPTGKVITKVDVTATGSGYFAGLNTAAQYSPAATISTSGNTATATFAAAVQAQTVTANTNATGRLTAIKIYYDDPSAAATIAVDKSAVAVAVGYDATFKVTTLNLSSNFSVTGGNSTYFTTSYTASSTDGDHTVTLHGVAATSSAITLTISATGVTSVTVSVTVEEPVLYEKVVAASSLKAGKEIVIGTTDGAYVVGKYVSGNNCPAVTAAANNDGDLISTYLPADGAVFTLGGESGAWTLTDQDDKIYYGTSGENQLKANTTSTDTWSISITSSGVATISSAASSRSIKKNSSNTLFSTYASGQTDVAIYMVPSSDPEVQVTVDGSQSLGVGETAVLTAAKLNGASGTVGWATSNSSILSISAATGDSITVTAGSTLGNATITTSLSGCDDVETVFTVRKGSAAAPYTVAEAMAAIDGSDAAAKTNVYTSGIVSQVDSLNSDNSITYWISDDGKTTTQMEAYKGFGLNSATFSAVTDLAVGDEVTINGNLTKYSSTYEYAAGNKLTSFNRPVSAVATITSISGTLSAKAGTAAWDLSGLTVYGTMSGSNEVVDVTIYVDLTTSDVPGTPSETTVRNVSVTATSKQDSSVTLTQNVSATVVVDSGLVANGNYRIQATRGDVTYYLKSNGTSSAPSAVTSFYEATVFTFTVVDENTYTIKSGNDYLYSTSSNNGVRVGSTADSWLITAGTQESGAYDLKETNNNRYLTLYNAQDWRAYTTADATNREENTDLQAFNATQFAAEFLSTYTAGCIQSGSYDANDMMWDTAAAQYALLASADQTALTNASASESGTTVQQAAARYDYIVGKYGTSTFSDFMSRTPSAPSNPMRAYIADSSTASMIVIITAVLGVTTVGGYFFLRKKKEQ